MTFALSRTSRPRAMTKPETMIMKAVMAILAGVAMSVPTLIGCASQSKSCGPETTSCCAETPTPRDQQPRDLSVLGDDLSPLRAAFNAHADRWRVVSLVSPTCSECVLGAEAVQKEIVDRYPAARVSALSIWIPMLATDNEQAARASATIFPEDRAVQFYDGRQSVGWAYARGTFAGFIDRARKSLPPGHYLAEAFDDPQRRNRPQWDLYMLYAPGVRWEQAPPVPTHWIRHCGRTDGQKSTYWVDSPDAAPREGNLFEAMRQMADKAIDGTTVRDGAARTKIEVLGFDACPNTTTTKTRVEQAVASLGLRADVAYVDQMSLAEADLRRGWPAPTILVNGRDLFGMETPKSGAMSCRMYPAGAPTRSEVEAALRRVAQP